MLSNLAQSISLLFACLDGSPDLLNAGYLSSVTHDGK